MCSFQWILQSTAVFALYSIPCDGLKFEDRRFGHACPCFVMVPSLYPASLLPLRLKQSSRSSPKATAAQASWMPSPLHFRPGSGSDWLSSGG